MQHPFRVALVLSLFLASAPALAQTTTGSYGTNREVARLRFQQGMEAAKSNRWDDALSAFQAAYEAFPRSEILLNLATAQVKTGRLMEGAQNYDRFLRETVGSDKRTRSIREATQRAFAQVQVRIPKLRFKLEGDTRRTDVILVDGKELTRLETEQGILVNPGQHETTLRRGGDIIARTHVVAVEGKPAEANLFVVAPTYEANPQTLTGRRASGKSIWTSPWFLGGLAVVIVGGIVTGVVLATQKGSDSPDGSSIPPIKI